MIAADQYGIVHSTSTSWSDWNRSIIIYDNFFRRGEGRGRIFEGGRLFRISHSTGALIEGGRLFEEIRYTNMYVEEIALKGIMASLWTKWFVLVFVFLISKIIAYPNNKRGRLDCFLYRNILQSRTGLSLWHEYDVTIFSRYADSSEETTRTMNGTDVSWRKTFNAI